MDALRKQEFGYLDDEDHCYLDYTGAALPPRSLLDLHHTRLTSTSFGNPHSASPASARSTELVEEARKAVLAFFRASPDEYTVVFTANATGACRLVGEAFPFGPGVPFLHLGDNHNSVLGIRRFATARGARVETVRPDLPDLRTSYEALAPHLHPAGRRSTDSRSDLPTGLFAFPAQSNSTGVQHPLDWIDRAREAGWRVLLDAAAYAPANPLDLSRHHPDFVCLSWYKILGFPTGVGSLIARRDALAALRRPWFSGGTVRASSTHLSWHVLDDPPASFEDGTLDFQNIPAVAEGLNWLTGVGISAVHDHATRLTARLLDGLRTLTRPDGTPAVLVHGPDGTALRGSTVALTLVHADGRPLDDRLVVREAARAGISLRTGCFCNPGVGEALNHVTADQVRRALAHDDRPNTEEYVRRLHPPYPGVVRVSAGMATSAADIDRFLALCRDLATGPSPHREVLPPRTAC
ncbi:aminotransferase class V-fold PLP-dependent enzyme [Streptomyces spiroverticillatus]|uniref:Aminotransferase class V-fold PLP-dependent enzyme n=1 Tax=Streptomyces finlayi TaxID=67296 RepID=A0A919CB49_9ACTN|nr:aminotransferase class V-fold PLP-dependent enzyme [Streptomyces finlayi]GHA16874.1 aminotransferase class V-fold PLP-dependent enzyme [Streptomyces spiroverticillatus]GHC99009.1 aminotransferase class V-fold PLP-dependent enzyme [Streptomyces finlayi]